MMFMLLAVPWMLVDRAAFDKSWGKKLHGRAPAEQDRQVVAPCGWRGRATSESARPGGIRPHARWCGASVTASIAGPERLDGRRDQHAVLRWALGYDACDGHPCIPALAKDHDRRVEQTRTLQLKQAAAPVSEIVPQLPSSRLAMTSSDHGGRCSAG